MRIRLQIIDVGGEWHAYLEVLDTSVPRRYVPRKRLWEKTYPGVPPLDFCGVLEVLAAVIEDANSPAPCSPAERGSASLEGS